MEDGFLRCTAPLAHADGGWFFVMHRTFAHVNGECFFAMHRTLAHAKGEWFYQWGMSMVGRSFLCRIILVGIVLKLWLSIIFSMIYLSIKCFYEKMLEKLVFCC